MAEAVSATKRPIILSCEHFSSRLIRTRQLETLHDALSADEIKVIYYIREPSDLALAAWSTRIFAGEKLKFSTDDVTPENRYFNHLETLNLWGSVFGEQNLIVREYNRASLAEGDIRKDFCALLGIQTAPMEFEEDQNQSLDAQRLQVLRYINCALSEFHESEVEWRRAQNIRQLISTHIPSGGQLTALMSDQQRTLIKSRFATVNSEISQRYFGGHLSRDWFPDCTVHEAKADLRHHPDIDLLSALRETVIRVADASMVPKNKRKKKSKVKNLLKRIRVRFFSAVSEPKALQ